MPGFSEFQTFIAQEAASLFADMSEVDMATVRHNTAALLGMPEVEPAPPPHPQNPKERMISKLLLGLSEVLDSVQNLQNIAVYTRRFPYARSGIEKGAYLRYHLENHLSELYILEERMYAYLTFISRQYRRDSRARIVSRVTDAIRNDLASILSGVRQARGTHVHEQRYSDPELDRLRTLEIIKGQNSRWADLYELVYRQTREARLKRIAETNRTIQGLLDIHFEYLLSLLRGGDGHLRMPDNSGNAPGARPLTP